MRSENSWGTTRRLPDISRPCGRARLSIHRTDPRTATADRRRLGGFGRTAAWWDEIDRSRRCEKPPSSSIKRPAADRFSSKARPGIGKTALVDELLRRHLAIEVPGPAYRTGGSASRATEAPRPTTRYWKRWGSLCRGSGSDSIVETLVSQAPDLAGAASPR